MQQQLRKIKVKLRLVASDLGKENRVSPDAGRASAQKGPENLSSKFQRARHILRSLWVFKGHFCVLGRQQEAEPQRFHTRLLDTDVLMVKAASQQIQAVASNSRDYSDSNPNT